MGLPRHGGRRWHRPARLHPHVVLFFGGHEQDEASAKLISKSFRIVAGGIPRDVTVTVETPEGDPGSVLADMATPGDLLVVGQERALSIRRIVHGSVSRYCSAHSRCPVVVVPASPDRASDHRTSEGSL